MKPALLLLNRNQAVNLPLVFDSLLGQSFKDFKLIFVDSDSEDESVQIAHTYKDKFDMIIYARGHKRGRHVLAMQEAIGKFCQGQIADDLLIPITADHAFAYDAMEWYTTNIDSSRVTVNGSRRMLIKMPQWKNINKIQLEDLKKSLRNGMELYTALETVGGMINSNGVHPGGWNCSMSRHLYDDLSGRIGIPFFVDGQDDGWFNRNREMHYNTHWAITNTLYHLWHESMLREDFS